jgi:hypothetical protein
MLPIIALAGPVSLDFANLATRLWNYVDAVGNEDASVGSDAMAQAISRALENRIRGARD